jgi:hypothetical protein
MWLPVHHHSGEGVGLGLGSVSPLVWGEAGVLVLVLGVGLVVGLLAEAWVL